MIFATFKVSVIGAGAFGFYEIFAFDEDEAIAMATERFVQKRIKYGQDTTINNLRVKVKMNEDEEPDWGRCLHCGGTIYFQEPHPMSDSDGWWVHCFAPQDGHGAEPKPVDN